MDILLHILLIVIIGVFFFLDKYSVSFNPMFFVIIFSTLGFVFVQTGDIEYIDYSTKLINSTHEVYETINLNSIGTGLFTVQSFIVLVYWFTFILAGVNIFLGNKDSKTRF